ncbi:MAG: phosphatase PAP2 family protein [Ignavibacteria bacterium]|nr:phosphatase PAP2 family protein [Ignavibacteria bacterium]
MLEFLQTIDTNLFYFINVTLANPVTDALTPFITEREHWFIFFGIMWLVMLFKGGKRGKIAAILILITITVSDQTSSFLLKDLFARIRPCNVLDGVHLIVNCTGSYSFPSSHAVNHFAGASMLGHFFPEYRVALYGGGFLVAISRVFNGVHYPFDVLGGIIVGMLIGYIIVYLWLLLNRYLKIEYKKV